VSATLGIDLASQPKRTAVAVIAWDQARPRLIELALHRDRHGDIFHDKYLITTATNLRRPADCPEIAKVAIDAPLGWPRDFVSALAAYTEGLIPPVPMDFDKSSLYRRTTDALIAERTEANPLPVSVDKIGYCAIRAAVLVGEIARLTSPEAAARDGSGIVCEVYPAPAIRRWLDVRGYKGAAGTAIRAEMVDRIVGATRMCDPFRLLERARESPDDDLLDALICALLGRACELGQTDPVPPEHHQIALEEGWIHLPAHALEALGSHACP
jgi:hypothetical protein